jgi:hypothetical protein
VPNPDFSDTLEDIIDVLKRKVYEKFPSANVNVVHEEDNDEYFFSVDSRKLYYSDDFQNFIMKLKIDMLWPENIYNIFFTLDNTEIWSTIKRPI